LWPDVDREYYQYLRAETFNPFTFGSGASRDDWLESFNAPFKAHGLSSVLIDSGTDCEPFDRVYTEEPKVDAPSGEELDEAPLVSVVLTTYKPSRRGLRTSVNSILQQTLRNIELIVVDDASGAEYEGLLSEIE